MRIDGLPVHPITVHFPIALLSISALWDGLGLWTGSSLWWTMSYWTLVAGLVASLPALGSGFVEFVTLPSDSPAGNLVIWHLMLTATAVTCFLGSLLIRGEMTAPTGGQLAGTLAFSIVGLVLLAAGGHLGAKLVYEYGVGRVRPDAGTDETAGEPF